MYKIKLLNIFFLVLLLSGCDISFPGSAGDPEPIFQTTILSINFSPDTLIVGDTLTIHCLISDSLDERFKFNWNLGSDRTLPVNGVLDGNKIRWRSKENDLNGFVGEVVLFSGSVEVVNPSDTINLKVVESFVIKIKQREN
ncbi:MAG: hypothetical protein RLN90_02300 [Balneolaceae bacterium]